MRRYTYTCRGVRQDSAMIRLTSAGSGVHQTLVATATDIRAGDTIGLTTRVTTPFARPGQSVEVIGEDGSRQVLDSLAPECAFGELSSTFSDELG